MRNALSVAIGAIALAYIDNNDTQDVEFDTLREILQPLLQSKTTITTPIEKEVKKMVKTTNEAGEEIEQEITEIVKEVKEEVKFQALLDANINEFDTLKQMLQTTPLLVLGAEVYEIHKHKF